MGKRILRVGMTYPRENEQGIGQHCRYHSLLSNYNELILTAKRKGDLLPNRVGVTIIEIDIQNKALGVYEDLALKRILAAIKKLKSQIDFLNKSKAYIDEFKPELVHIYTPIPILVALYSKRKYKSKIVMSLHGSDALRMNKVSILANVLRLPDAVVTVSESMIDILPPKITKKAIVNIGNGVDLSIFYPQNRKRNKQFLHVGSLRWQKGQKYLLEGFAKFSENNPDYILKIIGDGEEKNKLLSICDKLNIAEKVVFLGNCKREKIAEELNDSRAFVLTSVSEGFPKVIIEAMATGTPVISSDVGNVKNVVGNAGITFPMKDSNAIAAAMERIINDDDSWGRMSEDSIMRSRNYSWENHVEKLNKVYEEVFNND